MDGKAGQAATRKDRKMTFSDFAHRIGKVLRGADSQSAFTKSLFETILSEERDYLLEGISDSTWKSYFNGGAQITRLAKKINAYTDPMAFEPFISDQEEPAVQKLCDTFSDVLPEINMGNAGEMIAGLFDVIIDEAAADKKNSEPGNQAPHPASETAPAQLRVSHEQGTDPFQEYIDKANSYYSLKKTLLYAETPRPFYSMYVCNDLRLFRFPGIRRNRMYVIQNDATVSLFEKHSKYNIIQGTGGIGKSMYMNHLFLSSASEYQAGKKLPILILLKDYKDNFPDLITFMLKTINDFAPEADRKEIIEKLEKGQIVLLLDGLDEIQSQLKESFDSNLEAFIKRYPDNSVFMTSRPITDLVAYSHFSIYDIEPLRKKQAIELVEKLEFWDEEIKKNFINDLDNHLFASHEQFASNPLLLTIMLMTYSIHGDIPAKMHTFYAKAYETMARLHDATKGSYKRPLHTGLTPEDFSVYFSQFCARTFIRETIEFTKNSFSQYMQKVIKDIDRDETKLSPPAFLQDLTDNLCIMYREGEKYYFIHRSFQEYFAALYFVNNEDDLLKAGEYFEEHGGLFFRRTLEMMYEMETEKVERLVFYPYLKKLMTECDANRKGQYWGFLQTQYPTIYCNEGELYDPARTIPASFLYDIILEKKNMKKYHLVEDYHWSRAVREWPCTNWVWAYDKYLTDEAFLEDQDWEEVKATEEDMSLVMEDSLPKRYRDCFGWTNVAGSTYEIDTEEALDDSNGTYAIMDDLKNDTFPLRIEYESVLAYYTKLEARIEKKQKAKTLFDD